ncbi:MAG: hypothetical protein ACXABD_20240 [Candidatus Thorarchaeota archaeon]|jgi:hypothetical protein
MPKTGHFYHEVQSLTDVNVSDAFSGANKTDLNLNNFSLTTGVQKVGGVFVGKLEGLIIRVKSIANSPTKLIIKVTHNVDGSQVIIPDTEATIALEVGSTTEGGVAYKFDFPYLHTDDEIHIFYKTDVATSTCVVDALEFYWSE